MRQRHTHTYTYMNQLAFAVSPRTYIYNTHTHTLIHTNMHIRYIYTAYTLSKYVCIYVYAWYLSSSIHTLLSVYVAVSCSVLQCLAVCRSMLRHIAVYYNGWHTYVLAYKRCFMYDTIKLSPSLCVREK